MNKEQEANAATKSTKVMWQPFVEMSDGELVRFELCPSHPAAVSAAEKFATELEEQGKAVNVQGVLRVAVPLQ